IVSHLATTTAKHAKLNVIIPDISPADIREIKRILAMMQLDYTLLPDYSTTLDRPLVKPYRKVPDGGTKIEDIMAMPGARATVQFGLTLEQNLSPGHYLAKEFGVPLYNLPIPIGVQNTDLFLQALQEISGVAVPAALQDERGRLLDAMVDSHKYNFQGRSVIFGEAELVYAVCQLCLENGVYPVTVATGSKNSPLAQLLQPKLTDVDHPVEFIHNADFVAILAHSMDANIAIGPSDGRYLTEKQGIPLVRLGFPIHDRVGGQRILSVGYAGSMMLLDQITNTLLAEKQRGYRQTMYDTFYRGADRLPDATLPNSGLRGERHEL
ncbi:MAG: nitrogenase, partial [Peptococcaceae bacterium]|nr:nitrogenase [Peptococcaceae bacterium]